MLQIFLQLLITESYTQPERASERTHTHKHKKPEEKSEAAAGTMDGMAKFHELSLWFVIETLKLYNALPYALSFCLSSEVIFPILFPLCVYVHLMCSHILNKQ